MIHDNKIVYLQSDQRFFLQVSSAALTGTLILHYDHLQIGRSFGIAFTIERNVQDRTRSSFYRLSVVPICDLNEYGVVVCSSICNIELKFTPCNRPKMHGKYFSRSGSEDLRNKISY